MHLALSPLKSGDIGERRLRDVLQSFFGEETLMAGILSDALKQLAAEEGSPACAVVVLVGAGDARLASEVMRANCLK
jgi:hypothetical protein